MRFITAHALGAFLAGMAVLAHPFAADYLADCLASAVAWPLNVDGKRIPGPLTPTTLERLADAGQDIARLGWLHIAAILGLALTLNKPTAPAVVRNLAAVTGVWYVAAMASSLMGWASYAHYQYVAFAPLAISAGLFAWSLPLRFQRWAPIALLIVTIAANSAQAARTILRDRARDDGPKAALVSHIRSQTAPSDTVFFWIGGSDADLMHRADRPPGLRHFLAASCFNMDMRLFSEFANEFLARPPDWIVEDRNLNRPSLREPGRYDWEARVPDLARLQRFVQRAYAPVATFGDFELLRRRDLLSFDGLQ
jgi:hypothetical protein